MPDQADPTRAALIEAMARANCRANLLCDPDELGECSGIPAWQLYTDEMEPLLDALMAASASMRTLAPMLARIAGAAA